MYSLYHLTELTCASLQFINFLIQEHKTFQKILTKIHTFWLNGYHTQPGCEYIFSNKMVDILINPYIGRLFGFGPN